jgi:leader peptidase (prepilin peptidase)/N-methyltransferase
MVIIKFVIFAMLLIYASVSDIRKREVSDYVGVMIAITALIAIPLSALPNMMIGASLIALPQLIVAVMKPNSYGGADIKIMTASAFLLGLERGLIAIIIGLAFGLLTTTIICLMQKKKMLKVSFPVVPYLAVGSIIAFLI